MPEENLQKLLNTDVAVPGANQLMVH